MRTKEEIKKDIDATWEQYWKFKDEYREVQLSKFPKLINKFWKIDAPFGWTTYMHVSEFFLSGDRYVIRGNGFEWETSEYLDECSMHWSGFKDIFVPEQDIVDFLENKVVEITKEEFKKKFSEMIKECTKEFNEITEIVYE